MRALRIAGLIAVNVALALVAAEGLLRVVEPVPQTGLQIQPCIFEYDAKLGYRYRPGAQGKLVRFHEIENWVEINDSGFHDVPWPAEKRDGVQRVVAFGDSFTASLHVPADETWTRTLEASLNDRSGVRRFEVLNAGLSGTGTRTHAGLMDELLPALAPDIVLLMFFANDVSDFTRGVVYYECVDGMILAYQNDAQKSEELRLIAERYDHPALNRWTEKLLVLQFLNYYLDFSPALNVLLPSDAQSHPAGDEYAELWHRMRELADGVGARLVVVPVPMRPADGPFGLSFETAAPYAQASGIELLDVRGEISAILADRGIARSEMFWRSDGHHNALGNEIFGNAVASVLRTHLLSRTSAPR